MYLNQKNAVAIAIWASIFLASCSSQPTESENQDAPAATEAPMGGQSAVKDDVSEKNLVQVASGSADHTTLVAAVKAGDLVDALSNAGPFTVFAPTNAAFDKLPAGTVEGLLKPEKKEDLQNILEYHVSLGVYQADALTDGQTLGQVNGGNITISKKGNDLFVNGTSKIIASIKASNGVIHVLDGVLLPPAPAN